MKPVIVKRDMGFGRKALLSFAIVILCLLLLCLGSFVGTDASLHRFEVTKRRASTATTVMPDAMESMGLPSHSFSFVALIRAGCRDTDICFRSPLIC